MYRIELAPGEVTAFRTIEELAIGIRNGLVTGRSRIYHNASQKWLPIEFHPHYKKALELSTQRQEIPTLRVPERLDTLSFAVARPAPVPAPAPPATNAAPEPVASAPPAPAAPAAPAGPADASPRVSTALVAPVSSAPARLHVAPRPVKPEPIAPVVVSSKAAVAWEPEVEPAVIRTKVEFPALQALVEEATAETEARESLPPAVASPVAQFPAIVYPEITPADPPVAEPTTPAARSRRPLHVAGAIVVLALGGYGMMSLAPSGEAAAAIPSAERPALPPTPSAPPASVERSGANGPAPSETPRPVTLTQPASSGFAPALEARAIVGATAAPPALPSSAPLKDSLVAPAPVGLELDVPVIAGADSLLAPPRSGDSTMKRILRAVNGGKEGPPAR